MKANAIARNYGCLTPEERFRLILAAGGRGDEAERERLMKAGGRITLVMSDHAPFAHAFAEIALLVFIELLDAASSYLEASHMPKIPVKRMMRPSRKTKMTLRMRMKRSRTLPARQAAACRPSPARPRR